jgi:CubicO group peptidase (beta-lactamase class C family)
MPDMLEDNAELRRQHAPLARFISGAIRDTVPLFPPGTNFSYQSMGTLVVAHLIERISGLSIADFLRREVFTPLKMTSSSLGSRGVDRSRIIRVRLPGEHEPDWGWNSRYWQELGSPWGTMFSTPDDMAVIADLLLRGGEQGGARLISATTTQLMTTNRLDELQSLPAEVRQAHRWGLGWKMNYPADDDRLCDLLTADAFGHTGSTGNLMWMDPATQSFCIILTTSPRALAPWRLVSISNAVAAALRG